MYYLLYYVIQYRKKTVMQNIKHTLPLLTKEKQLTIQKNYYRHLCDMFFEIIKALTLSEKEKIKRCSFTNIEVYEEFQKKEKSIIIMGAHYAGYECATMLKNHSASELYFITKKFKNYYANRLICAIRKRYKIIPLETKKVISVISDNSTAKKKATYVFICDQSPKLSPSNYYTSFMGIETPFHIGPEKLSKRYNMNILFLKTNKVKRGHYEVSFEVITTNAQKTKEGEITQQYIKLVEEQIHKAPEYYLWSHKRWKHSKQTPCTK